MTYEQVLFNHNRRFDAIYQKYFKSIRLPEEQFKFWRRELFEKAGVDETVEFPTMAELFAHCEESPIEPQPNFCVFCSSHWRATAVGINFGSGLNNEQRNPV